ncbi:hypothetical protein NBRC116589_10510 [Ruegeria sp. HU-ET01832]|uniref:hypothetical protein n=1 Tax=Ruegeria sp. HU-ET01832 TaxID=3135906 RepID=UPI0031031395
MAKATTPRPYTAYPVGFVGILPQKLRMLQNRVATARSSVRRIRAYWLMNDDELRARGLKREDIIRLVLADVI